jgi:hypothetical protein
MYRYGAGIVEEGGVFAVLVEQLARVSMVLILLCQYITGALPYSYFYRSHSCLLNAEAGWIVPISCELNT